jgi:hypothetical protein
MKRHKKHKRRKQRQKKRNRREHERRSAERHAAVGTVDLGDAPKHEQRRTHLRVLTSSLELAKGYDGLLRGLPEPTVIVGAWVVGPTRAQLVGRTLVRFACPKRFPGVVNTVGPVGVRADVAYGRPAQLVLLAVAIEEDSGTGVREVFAALERQSELTLIHTEDAMPHGDTIAAFTRDAKDRYLRPRPVDVHVGGADLSTLSDGDDLVGAAVCVLDFDGRLNRTLRFHLRSEDGRNDWTVRLEVKG